MSHDLDLGPDHSWYHKNAEETSAEAVLGKNLQAISWQVLALYGEGWALTPDEAADKLGKHLLSVRPPVSKLKTNGYLEILRDEHGNKVRRPNTVSGENAMVHVISPKGLAALRNAPTE